MTSQLARAGSNLTPTRLHKLRRNAAIVILGWFGFSADALADVFDLDVSMVRKILRAGWRGKLGDLEV